jgi:hypothetical protein
VIEQCRSVFLRGYRHIADALTGGFGDFRHGLTEREEPGACDFIELAYVLVLGQRGGREVGDVLHIDKRFRHVSGREGQLSGHHRLGEETLAKVLAKPTRPHNGPLGARTLDGLLAKSSALFASPRQQDQTPHAARSSSPNRAAAGAPPRTLLMNRPNKATPVLQILG